MKKFIPICLFFLAFTPIFGQKKIQLGDEFPCAKLKIDASNYEQTIAVFVPSLRSSCNYASMLSESLYHYFHEQKAFESWTKKPKIQLVFVVKQSKYYDLDIPKHIHENIKIIHDSKGLVFNELGVTVPQENSDDATLVVLDSKGNVQYLDSHYRAEGEQLKPLEHFIKKTLQHPVAIYKMPKPDTIKVGKKAPNFQVDSLRSLADLKGNIVLISFYPAAFSGTLNPFKNIPGLSKFADDEKLRYNPFELDYNGVYKIEMPENDWEYRGCMGQIKRLDTERITTVSNSNISDPKPTHKGPNASAMLTLDTKKPLSITRIMVSESTPSLLAAWQKELGTKNVLFTNDVDYKISQLYNSFNVAGQYNNRVSVVLDETGKITYIDWYYTNGDEKALEAEIQRLATKE